MNKQSEASNWPGCDAVLTPEKRFRVAALAGRNCFLTGMGGTGKTWELKELIAQCARRVDVTAPTGVAALNAGELRFIRQVCTCIIEIGFSGGLDRDSRNDPDFPAERLWSGWAFPV